MASDASYSYKNSYSPETRENVFAAKPEHTPASGSIRPSCQVTSRRVFELSE
jgi:hypothetical protein